MNRFCPPTRVQRNHAASLKKLHLGCNEIASVGDVLPSLTRLTELCLEGNRLTELPQTIGQLTKLRELWVHGNALATLPEALGRCASLTVLQAHHNQLRDLPDALASLSRLQGVRSDGAFEPANSMLMMWSTSALERPRSARPVKGTSCS